MTKVIYAVGDLHGRLDLLIAIRNMIKFDAKKHGFEDKKIVYLGDYVDRGPESAGVVDTLMNKPMDGFTEIHLKGNHEEIMYKSIDESNRSIGGRSSFGSWRDMWLTNGGGPTLESYGIDVNTAVQSWNSVTKKINREHIHWMKALPCRYVEDNYVFVHAGLQPGVALYDQNNQVMMWIRDEFTHCDDPFLDHMNNPYKVVHGHTPSLGGVTIKHNRIGLDTGAVWTGVQHAIALHDGQERILKTPQFNLMTDKEQRF